jgi:hypothetical protein
MMWNGIRYSWVIESLYQDLNLLQVHLSKFYFTVAVRMGKLFIIDELIFQLFVQTEKCAIKNISYSSLK